MRIVFLIRGLVFGASSIAHRVHAKGERSLDRISVDRNCVLSVDRNCGNQLTEFLDGFQLIESFNNDFGQTPKNLSVDQIILSTDKFHQFFFGS
jgi:hypothetical protein